MQVKSKFGHGPMIFDKVITFEDMLIHGRNMQVKFEFGHGPMTFDRVILLELTENKKFYTSTL
jgi:hypothetical protein